MAMQDVLSFLNELDHNNNRDWFVANKKRFDEVQNTVKDLTESIKNGLNKVDVLESAKVFRIYRDVRFSADKTPYKNNFGIGFTREGKFRRGGFYLHIQPGESFIGGGFWQPEPHDLKRIRDEFASDPESIKPIISDPTFKKYFKVIEGEALSRPPKGFDASLPGIELVKKKNYLLTRKVDNQLVLSPNFDKEVVATFTAMLPFFTYMTEILTTNINGELIV
jgi:uncharacterized protein (TIGR02453 family)